MTEVDQSASPRRPASALGRAERAVFDAATALADSVLLAPVALLVLAPMGLALRVLDRATRGLVPVRDEV